MASKMASKEADTLSQAVEKVRSEYEEKTGERLMFTFTSSGKTYPLPMRKVRRQTADMTTEAFHMHLLQKGVEPTPAHKVPDAKAIEATLVAEDKAVAARRAIDVAENARRQRVLRERAKGGDVLEMELSEPHHRPTKRVKKM